MDSTASPGSTGLATEMNDGANTKSRSPSTPGGNADTEKFIGKYSPNERYKRLLRFYMKRDRRVWTKKVKYDVRKNFADSRVRVKGRFVRKEDEVYLMNELSDQVGDGGTDSPNTNTNASQVGVETDTDITK